MSKRAPTEEELDTVETLLEEAEYNDEITEWEAGEFLPSLLEQPAWSEKQLEVLGAIYGRIFP